MHDRGVIAPAEVSANLFERVPRVLAGQIHDDLAWPCDGPGLLLGLKVRQFDAVERDGGIEDGLHRGARERVFLLGRCDGLVCESDVDRAAVARGTDLKICDGALEFANVRVDTAGHVLGNPLAEFESTQAGFGLHDGDAGFVVGSLDR